MSSTDLASNILTLIDTALDGLEYVYEKNRAGHYQLATPAFWDVAHKAVEIKRTLYQHKIVSEPVIEQTEQALNATRYMIKAYEQKMTYLYQEIMETELYPQFFTWKEVLEKALSEYQDVEYREIDQDYAAVLYA